MHIVQFSGIIDNSNIVMKRTKKQLFESKSKQKTAANSAQLNSSSMHKIEMKNNSRLRDLKRQPESMRSIQDRVPKPKNSQSQKNKELQMPQHVKIDTLLLQIKFEHGRKKHDLQVFIRVINLIKSQSDYVYLYVSDQKNLYLCDHEANSLEKIKQFAERTPGLLFTHIRNANIAVKNFESGFFKIIAIDLSQTILPCSGNGKSQLSFFAGGQLGIVFRGDIQTQKMIINFQSSELKFHQQKCQNTMVNRQIAYPNSQKNINTELSVISRSQVFFPFIEPPVQEKLIRKVKLFTIKSGQKKTLKNKLLQSASLKMQDGRVRFCLVTAQTKDSDQFQLTVGNQIQWMLDHAQLKKQLKNQLQYSLSGKNIISLAKFASTYLKSSDVTVSISYYYQGEYQFQDKISLNFQILANDDKSEIQRIIYSIPTSVYTKSTEKELDQQTNQQKVEKQNSKQYMINDDSKSSSRGQMKNFKPQFSLAYIRKVIINRNRNDERIRQFDAETADYVLKQRRQDDLDD